MRERARLRGPARRSALPWAALSCCACSALTARLGPARPEHLPLHLHPDLQIPRPAMTAHSFALPVIIFTTFWGLIGLAGPWFVPKGPNRG